MTELPRLELYFYFTVWITGISFSLYRLYLVGRVFDHRHHDQYHYEDFKEGWSVLGGRYQDQADYEWNMWSILFGKLTPFLLVNLIVAEYMKAKKYLLALPLWYTTVTIFFLISYFNVTLTLWLIGQTTIYFVIISFKTHILIWLISFIIIHYLKPDIWFAGNEDDQYIVMVSSSWMVLRCISYTTDRLNKFQSEMKSDHLKISDIVILLGYSFYLPTMFCGPFISFGYFSESLNTVPMKWSFERIFNIAKDFARCAFWYFFTLFALHFLYVNAILLRPDFIKHLLDWELAGLGIAMGHFFHLKYVVFYGLACAWASAEGLATPKAPCCVSRVHLYSYMWRNFDSGLYEFLLRYIYVPIISRLNGNFIVRKVVASIGCFTFMFTWHRAQDYVFFWVLFNFIAVTIELIAKQIFSISAIQQFMNEHFSAQNQLRFQCFFAAPLHCFSMISNYFFIGSGMDIGLVYLKRISYGSLTTKLTILFFLYGAAHSAVATQMWRGRKEKQKNS